MSYQVLARKWRPNQFSDVLGQEHVLMALSNALSQQRLHHAYLLSGTRGVGKTTIARIFAKGLNCEQGIVATPCGTCATCQEIARGSFVDLLEIDAASRTKVEDTRELLDNVQYKPARGRFKVYLIDEVHMLSRHSFNALLKTLEEPPEHVKFILATTDPQKLPVTVLSRCLQLHLKHLDVSQIENKLTHILTQEALPFDAPALRLLAKAANGSMRDALSLTDQAIAQGAGSVRESGVASMLGILNSDFVLRLLEALAADSAPQLMQAVQELASSGVEWDRLLSDMAAQLHQLAVAQLLGPEYAADPSAPKIAHLSGQFSAQEVQLFYQIVLQGRQDLPFAPDGRSGVEMTLLRMLAFRPEEISPISLAPLAHDHAIAGNSSALCATQPASMPVSTHAAAAKNLTALKAQLQQKEPPKPAAPVAPQVSEAKQEIPLQPSEQSMSAPPKKAERDDNTPLAPASALTSSAAPKPVTPTP
ncbi:MAG: DNA polymerase III subunit gamma/tau, partial [Vibrionaceae bacterium]